MPPVTTCGMRIRCGRQWGAIAGGLIAFGLAVGIPQQLLATTFTCAADDSLCLIAAINAANVNGLANTIRLAAGTYALLAADNNTDGPNGLPSITSTLRIVGAGAGATSIARPSSAPFFRLLHVGAGGSLTLTGVTLTGGYADPRVNLAGGALFNSGGAVTLQRCTVSGNTGGHGGGLFNGKGVMALRQSTLSHNNSADGGGLLNGGGLVTLRESVVSGNEGGGLINDRGVVNISWSTFANNATGFGPGGLGAGGTGSAVRITNSRFTGNGGGLIAGAINIEDGTLFVAHSTFDHNGADGSGAIGASAPGHQVVLVITDSAFQQNVATEGTITLSDGAVTFVMNTTFAANSVPVTGTGGQAVNNSSGTLMLINSTLADNSGNGVAGPGGALFTGIKGRTILANTLIARSTGPSNRDCVGPTTSIGNNLIGDPAGCGITLLPSDLTGDPGLNAFADDGEPGNGHYPLLPTSRAIDAGNSGICPRADQVGHRRIGPCDIGASAFHDDGDHRHRETNDDSHLGDDSHRGEDSADERESSAAITGLVQTLSSLKVANTNNDDVLGQIKAFIDLLDQLTGQVRSDEVSTTP